jgi:arabinose-5-phosphate isomerase
MVSPSSSFDRTRALRLAQETFDIEAAAVQGLKARTGDAFAEAVHAMLMLRGRVVVMGMGKSGHVGRKIAATLASTGTPSFFVHPAEAAHGDLGMVTSGDVCLLISNSGESNELAAIIPALRRLGVTLVALTGRAESALAKVCDIVLSCAVDKEACTLNLAPTASTAAQMAMGDALAVALLDARGFREEDFALSHPGGALGRKLLMHVSDLMRSGDAIPRVPRDADFSTLLRVMSSKGLGLAAVVDGNTPVGIFTDGDLRRLIETGADLRQRSARDVMHPRPHLIRANSLAVDAADLMERHRVTALLVVDAQGELVGALNTYDLLHAKVI